MSDGEDDLPLSTRARVAIAGNESDSDDDVPLSARVPGATTGKRKNMSNRNRPAHKRKSSDTEDDADYDFEADEQESLIPDPLAVYPSIQSPSAASNSSGSSH